MTVYVTAVDEPIYLVPYIKRVIEGCGATVVGVAELIPRRRLNVRRGVTLALLALLVFSPRQLARLAGFRVREAGARLGLGTTRHRLADVCRELAVPFRRIESANDPAFAAHLAALGVDVLLNQTSERLHAPLLSTPRLGVINRHLSPLPAYRGAWPIFWQFAHREATVGVTVHVVDAGLDTGDILAQAVVQRPAGMSMAAATAQLFERAAPLTCEALRRLESGAPRTPNAGPRASTFKTPSPSDVLRYLLGRPVRAGAA
jgi:folate-dependent phosphoribosylglycinamide formyltransferase PurN